MLIFFLFLVTDAISDLPGTEEIIKESFENGFPPNDWRIETKDSEKKWEIKVNAWDDQLFAYDGKYFAFIDQSDNQIINTTLVSPWIENEIDPCFGMEIFAAIAYKENDYDNFVLSIQVSQDYGISEIPSWQSIYIYNMSDNLQKIDQWMNINSQIDTSNKLYNKYRIGINYNGNNTKGFGLDDIMLICLYQKSKTNDANTSHARMDSCGCQIGETENNNDVSIIIIMLFTTYLLVKTKKENVLRK